MDSYSHGHEASFAVWLDGGVGLTAEATSQPGRFNGAELNDRRAIVESIRTKTYDNGIRVEKGTSGFFTHTYWPIFLIRLRY